MLPILGYVTYIITGIGIRAFGGALLQNTVFGNTNGMVFGAGNRTLIGSNSISGNTTDVIPGNFQTRNDNSCTAGPC